MCEFGMVAGSKIVIQKPTVFLCCNNKQLEIKNLNTTYNSIKNRNCLGINLTKDMQNLFSENYKTLLREIK